MVIRDLTRGDSAYFELSIKDENNELTTVDKIFMTVKRRLGLRYNKISKENR